MHPIRLYYLFFGITCFANFSATTYVPFLQEIGFTLGDVALVNALFQLIMMIAQVPTGMWADGKSRSKSVNIGIIFHIVGRIVYTFAYDFTTALIAEVIEGIGYAFVAGAMQAWLVDALAKHNESDKLQKVFATTSIIAITAIGAGGFIGAYTGSYRINFLIEALLYVVAWFFASRHMNGDGEPLVRLKQSTALKASGVALLQSPALRLCMVLACFGGCEMVWNQYWTPFFKVTIGQSGLGILWIAIIGAFMIGGICIRQMRIKKHQEEKVLLITFFARAFGILLIPLMWSLPFAITAALIHELGKGAFMTFSETYLQNHIESGYRATYSSVQALAVALASSLVLWLVWWGTLDMPANNTTISMMFIIAGFVAVIGACIGYLIRPK